MVYDIKLEFLMGHYLFCMSRIDLYSFSVFVHVYTSPLLYLSFLFDLIF